MPEQDLRADSALPRVLVVEDETMIAMLLEDMLDSLGYVPAGHAGTRTEATRLATNGEYDLALLDVNIGGGDVFPIAEILAGRGVPFLFCTGYGEVGLPKQWSDRPCLAKPFDIDQLEAALAALRA